METWKKSIQHFKIELRGEFEIKSEDTDFIQDFEIESDHVGTALTELGKQINIAMLGKAKEILKELFPKVDEKKLDSPKKEVQSVMGHPIIYTNKEMEELLKTEKKGCFNCYYFLGSNACNNRHSYSYKEFIYTTFKTGICKNWTNDSGAGKVE